MENFIQINKSLWNKKVGAHLDSPFYDMNSFLKGSTSLRSIELDLLGDIKGKSILHLQCHFGQDTISLARMGAKCVGVDFSDKAIIKAKELAQNEQLSCEFICSNVYDLPNVLNQQFDLVFTSYGVIPWLPDLMKWAEIIEYFLNPSGKFIFVEFHPVVWMFDDGFKGIKHSYFNEKPIVELEQGTYADREANISGEYVCWNHSLGEVMSSLGQQNLNIEHFQEYDFSPYNCFEKCIEVAPGKYQIEHLQKKIPMVYSLVVQKGSKHPVFNFFV